jgi:hypothetical protein
MKFFPSDPDARAALCDAIEDYVTTDDQLDWLGRRAVKQFGEWPGPMELRALFCNTFQPRDGVNAYSSIYPAEIAGRKLKELPQGRVVTADLRADAAFKIALELQALKDSSINARATPEEIAAAPEWLRRLEGYE